jgi:hypothetical protein
MQTFARVPALAALVKGYTTPAPERSHDGERTAVLSGQASYNP